MGFEQRIEQRRKFGYYMRVMDNNTHELLGYLSDISSSGFKLESQKPCGVDKDYTLRLERTSMVSDRPFIIFVARAVWTQPDPIFPNEYFEGFRIVSISRYEQEIFDAIIGRYGSPEN